MRMNRLRSALKAGQDFCQASCQKTCPYGHKESEDCHSASVPLRCTPSERQSSSRQQYPRLRPGYIKEKRSGDFRLFRFAPKSKDSSLLCPKPTGAIIDRELAVPRLSISADRPKYNTISIILSICVVGR